MEDKCECGHLKTCHNPSILDIHGGKCSHCDCKIFTWASFLYDDKDLSKLNKSKGEK